MENSGRDLAAIQYLRGIAALMVVMVHVDYQLGRLAKPLGLDLFAAGVDIFFVISGFIMWVSTARSPDRTAGQFLRDRIARIVPLYWSVTLFVAAVALLVPTAMQSTRFDPALLVASLFFIAWPNPSFNGDLAPLLVAGWTLNLEMFFYLLFALAMRLTDWQPARFALIVGMIVSAALAAIFVPGLPPEVLFYGQNLIIEFAFGLALGWLWLNRRPRQSGLWWLVSIAGFIGIFIEPLREVLPAFLAVGVPAAMVVAGAILAPTPRFPVLRMLGDSSYALYLTHALALSVLAQILKRLGLVGMPTALIVILCIAVSVTSGWIIYRLIERPLTQGAKWALGRGKPGARQPSAATTVTRKQVAR
ncbi:MAG: acyltransferase [Sphingomonadales bacterium]|nr:MAG: acyltransferase [Sphingomonadales bacterium]